MEINLYNQTGEEMGKAKLPERVFDVSMNKDLVHQAVVTQLANARIVIAHTKSRGEVRGGGKKPWKQKGTGRARHGSIRSPIWKGGGVAFGPRKDKNYSMKINKKQKTKALFMALTSKVKDNQVVLLDEFNITETKTKNAVNIFKQLFNKIYKASRVGKSMIVLPKKDENLMLSVRNLPQVKVILADSLNVYDVLSYKYLIMPKDAVEVIEKTYK